MLNAPKVTLRRFAHAMVVSGLCMGSATALAAQTWHVHLLDGVQIRATDDVVIESDGARLSASAGCNQIFGEVEIAESRFASGLLAMTRMACFGHLDDLETALVAAIEGANRITQTEQNLELHRGSTLLLRADANPVQP